MDIRAFARAQPVLSFYLLAFAISWVGMLFVIGGPSNIPGTSESVPEQMGAVVVALMSGPSVASLLMVSLTSGATGLRELAGRLLKWRVRFSLYAIAILTAPAVMTVIFLLLSLVSAEFTPPIISADGKLSLLLIAALTTLIGGLLEEVGWTGFAIPRFRQRLSILGTGVVVGVLWGAWHLLVNIWYSGANVGELQLWLFVPSYFAIGVAQLTAFRILMVWVYDRSGSLLIATLMHGGLIASTIPILAPSTSGIAFLTWFAISALAFWVLVGLLWLLKGEELTTEQLDATRLVAATHPLR